MFLFGYAVLLYNMRTVANSIGADRDDDDLGRTGNVGRAIAFLSKMIDNRWPLEIGEVPEGELSEFSEMDQSDFYLKCSV